MGHCTSEECGALCHAGAARVLVLISWHVVMTFWVLHKLFQPRKKRLSYRTAVLLVVTMVYSCVGGTIVPSPLRIAPSSSAPDSGSRFAPSPSFQQ